MAGIVVRGGKVLVTQRRADDDLGGLWELPGGKIRAGESAPDALVRELEEELGIGVQVGARWGELPFESGDRSVRLHFYFATLVRGAPETLGCDAYHWGEPARVRELPLLEPDRELIEDLIRRPRLWRESSSP